MTDEMEAAARAEEQRGPSDDELSRVSDLARQQREQEAAVQELESRLKAERKKLRQIQEVDLPEAMHEAGLAEAALDDGSRIVVKEGVNAHISKDRQDKAFEWLEQHGHGDLIKSMAQVNIGQDADLRQRVMSGLEQAGVDDDIIDYIRKVEPQTLKSWAREQIRQGHTPPEDLFGIYQYRQAKVEAPRK